MSQDRKVTYIDELCTHAHAQAQAGSFDIALHTCNTAIRFCTIRHLKNEAVLCKIWTQLGHIYYTRWLNYNSIVDLAGASDNLKKAIHYGHVPAIEAFGLLSMQCGNMDEAIGYFKKAIQEDVNRKINYRRMGICFQQIGNASQAAECFWEAYNRGDKESMRLLQSL